MCFSKLTVTPFIMFKLMLSNYENSLLLFVQLKHDKLLQHYFHHFVGV